MPTPYITPGQGSGQTRQRIPYVTPGQTVGQPTGPESYAGPEGGRTPLNVLAAMPGTVEGFAKGGLAFALATPYATVRGAFNAAVQGEIITLRYQLQ